MLSPRPTFDRSPFRLPLLILAVFFAASTARSLDLILEQDAWALGLGGAAAAAAGGTHAVLINPAGIASATVPMVQMGGVFRPEGFARGGHLVLLFPTGDRTVFGLTALQDEIPGSFRTRMLVGSAALPLQSNGDLRMGVNIKLITTKSESPVLSTADGLSLDLGWVYDWRLRNGDALSLALMARDLTGSVRRSPGLDEDVARSFTFGAAYQNIPHMRLEADFEVVDRTLAPTARKNKLRLGVERFVSARRYSVRVGYDDVFGDSGFFTLGAGWHPDRPFEVQAAGGFSEKEQKPMASLSAVYRFDRWKARGRSAQGAPEIEVERAAGPAATPVSPVGRPVSGTPLQKVFFTVSPKTISPNGDGKNDAAVVSLVGPFRAGSGRWEAEFRLVAGSTVRKFGGSGTPPPSFVWDGSGEDGRPVVDGPYELVLRTFDPAGGLASEDSQMLEVSTVVAALSLSADPSAFSPNDDQIRDRTVLRWTGDSARNASRWEWSVSPRGGGRAVYAARGRGRLPARLTWNGRETGGTRAPDGVYRVNLEVQDKAGNVLTAESGSVTLDTEAPVPSLELLTASADPTKNPLTVAIRAEDGAGIASWKVTVRDEWGKPFKSKSGTGVVPKTWDWDGSGDRGGSEKASPGAFYSVIFEAADAAGNRAQAKPVALQVEAGAAAGDSQQMTLNLSTVFFDERSASLGPEALKELRGAVESIRPYLAKSTLKVLGYADSAEGGDPILISHARAAAVRDFLAGELKIEPSTVPAVGYGTRDPLSSPSGLAPPDKQRRAVVTLVTTP